MASRPSIQLNLLFVGIVLTFLFGLLLPQNTLAKIGVGVGTGKIVLDEPLDPGTLYELPSITVLNTGDETGEYELDITYHEQQTQMRPDRSWMSYSPEKFDLAPGEVKEVSVRLALPVKTTPGDYFAYLEARPVATVSNEGGAVIGIAAASKLYFTVAPANIFQAIGYRIASYWRVFSPFPQIIVATLVILSLLKLASRFISLNVSLKPKSSSTRKSRPKSEEHEENIDE